LMRALKGYAVSISSQCKRRQGNSKLKQINKCPGSWSNVILKAEENE